MQTIHHEGKRFTGVTNTGSGEVSNDTVFEYNQNNNTNGSPLNILWATYSGGSVRFGTLTGLVLEQGKKLDFRYNHVNLEGEMMTGLCQSTAEILKDGRIRLHEVWKWSSGDMSSGTSIGEEIKEK